MKITDILKKVTDGKELTVEEKTFLASYKEPEQPEADKDRIPKARLDQEIARKKELEKELDEVRAAKEELEGKGLTEAEKLTKESEKTRKDLERLTKERDEAVAVKTAMEFKNSVTKLAGRHNFADAEYLEYLVKSKQVDLNDEKVADEFMGGLKKDSPKFFKVEGGPGAGTPPNTAEKGSTDYEAAKAAGNIEQMIAAAPEAK